MDARTWLETYGSGVAIGTRIRYPADVIQMSLSRETPRIGSCVAAAVSTTAGTVGRRTAAGTGPGPGVRTAGSAWLESGRVPRLRPEGKSEWARSLALWRARLRRCRSTSISQTAYDL